jgi:hypothetical protein
MPEFSPGFNNQVKTIYWNPNYELSTYEQLAEYLLKGKNKENRPIANNTRVIRRAENMIAIRLHNTDIITFYENGAIGLNSGGWKTVTTKDRMTRFTPRNIGVSSDRGVWYVVVQSDPDHPLWDDSNPRYLFEDGMHILPDGKVYDQNLKSIEVYDKEKAKELNRCVNKIQRFSRELVKRFFDGRSIPGPGDCFYCQFHAGSEHTAHIQMQTGKLVDGKLELTDGVDHSCIKSHLDEKYYVGSLVIAALNWNEDIGVYGLAPIDKHNIACALNPDSGHKPFSFGMTHDRVTRIVKRYIKSQLGFGM